MSDNFWNDETAKEFGTYVLVEEYKKQANRPLLSDLVKEFKKSKEKDIPNTWDRIEHENKCGYKILAGALLPNDRNHQYINSVQRLSDNEIFSIGDVVYITDNEEGNYKFIISKFELEPHFNLMATAKGASCRWHISLLKKEKPKPEWEILSFIIDKSILHKTQDGTFGDYNYIEQDLIPDKIFDIHSVSRITDNTTFTIKDITNLGIIKRFDIYGKNLMYVVMEEGSVHSLRSIYKKVKPKKVLRTTEDGIEISEGDSFYSLYLPRWEYVRHDLADNTTIQSADFVLFKSLEKLQEYILQYKPIQVTWRELTDNFNFHGKTGGKFIFLSDFFEAKQNQ